MSNNFLPGPQGELTNLSLSPDSSLECMDIVELDPLEPEFGRVAGSVVIDAAMTEKHYRVTVTLSRSA